MHFFKHSNKAYFISTTANQTSGPSTQRSNTHVSVATAIIVHVANSESRATHCKTGTVYHNACFQWSSFCVHCTCLCMMTQR